MAVLELYGSGCLTLQSVVDWNLGDCRRNLGRGGGSSVSSNSGDE